MRPTCFWAQEMRRRGGHPAALPGGQPRQSGAYAAAWRRRCEARRGRLTAGGDGRPRPLPAAPALALPGPSGGRSGPLAASHGYTMPSPARPAFSVSTRPPACRRRRCDRRTPRFPLAGGALLCRDSLPLPGSRPPALLQVRVTAARSPARQRGACSAGRGQAPPGPHCLPGSLPPVGPRCCMRLGHAPRPVRGAPGTRAPALLCSTLPSFSIPAGLSFARPRFTLTPPLPPPAIVYVCAGGSSTARARSRSGAPPAAGCGGGGSGAATAGSLSAGPLHQPTISPQPAARIPSCPAAVPPFPASHVCPAAPATRRWKPMRKCLRRYRLYPFASSGKQQRRGRRRRRRRRRGAAVAGCGCFGGGGGLRGCLPQVPVTCSCRACKQCT